MAPPKIELPPAPKVEIIAVHELKLASPLAQEIHAQIVSDKTLALNLESTVAAANHLAELTSTVSTARFKSFYFYARRLAPKASERSWVDHAFILLSNDDFEAERFHQILAWAIDDLPEYGARASFQQALEFAETFVDVQTGLINQSEFNSVRNHFHRSQPACLVTITEARQRPKQVTKERR